MTTINVDKEIALLKQADDNILDKIQDADKKLSTVQLNQSTHEGNDQLRHDETIKSHGELKELIISKMMHIEKYVDIKIKEHELRVEKNYAAKTEHMVLDKQVDNLDRRVGKMESVFSWAWKIVFGFIIMGILAVLFGKQ